MSRALHNLIGLAKEAYISRAALLFVTLIVIGALGAGLAIYSHAATPVASLEAENGAISSNASMIDDTSASSGQAVEFGQSRYWFAGCTNTTGQDDSWPNNCNTGVPPGTTLTPSTDTLHITTDGTVLQNMNISGGYVVVEANNVIIKNCKIDSTSFFDIKVTSGSVTIEDSELTGSTTALITGNNWTAKRLNLHATPADFIKLGNNTTLEDSWLHDPVSATGSHTDGVQEETGLSNVLVKHNYIDPSNDGSGGGNPYGNSAVFLKNDLGPDNTVGPITVTDNLLGGGNYTLYAVKNPDTNYVQGGITITNNHFLRDYKYGPWANNIPITQSGNVWEDTGQPITN